MKNDMISEKRISPRYSQTYLQIFESKISYFAEMKGRVRALTALSPVNIGAHYKFKKTLTTFAFFGTYQKSIKVAAM